MPNQFIKNTFWLYILTIAKLVFPLLTLPYLTRVLSMDAYGVAVYVKASVNYLQLFIDFGFGLSAVRSIVLTGGDKKQIGCITGTVILGKGILVILSAIIVAVAITFVPILNDYSNLVWLSFISVILSVFLLDFLFQGMEQMSILSMRFVAMKALSTVLTFVLVKEDADLLLIPLLDISSTVVAIVLTIPCVRRLNIRIHMVSFNDVFYSFRVSAVYFISNTATTAFGALNTLIIGIMLPVADVAIWSVALQLIGAAQSFYTPILNGMYPQMVALRSRRLLQKILLILMPAILMAAAITWYFAPWLIRIIVGIQYTEAVPIFRMLIPMLIVSFPAMVFGWPALGALGKAKETGKTTIYAALVQVGGIFLLIISHHFTLLSISLLRFVSEVSLLLARYIYYRKFIREFEE